MNLGIEALASSVFKGLASVAIGVNGLFGGSRDFVEPLVDKPGFNAAIAVEEFLDSRRMRGCSPATLRAYGKALRYFLEFAALRPDRPLDASLRAWISHLRVTVSSATVSSYGRHVIAWARWANARGAAIYVDDIRIRQVRGKAKALAANQVAALFAATSGPRRLFLRFLYDSGLRLSEALGLRVGDCIPGDHGLILSVRGKGGKIRMVTVGAVLEGELRAALAGLAADERLFTWTDSGVQTGLQRLSRRLGFRVSAHRLRHSFANATQARGIPMEMLRKLMGHADIATTDIYAQLYDHQVLEAFRRFSPVDGMEGSLD